MNIETFANSSIGKPLVKMLAMAMESKLRYRFSNPSDILRSVDNLCGHTVLEVGCGTGYFTIPAAQIIGNEGSLIAIDILSESVEFVSNKVRDNGLHHVKVLKANALQTGLESESFHNILLFGVIPAPMLPIVPLMNEMHRLLKPEGNLAVWPPVPVWLPRAILKTQLFAYTSKRNHVYNFRRI